MKDNKKKKSIIAGVIFAAMVIIIIIIVLLLKGCNADRQASGSSADGGIASAETAVETAAETAESVEENKNSADESVISDGETAAASDMTGGETDAALDMTGGETDAASDLTAAADSSKVEPASQEAPYTEEWTQTNDGYEGTVHNSSIDKVRYGTGDDSPSYDTPGSGDDPREEESESDAPVTPPVNPPIVPPEEITDDGSTPTKDDIKDYDDYEQLTKKQRDSIKSEFSSPMAYTVWLNGLIQKRLDKITDGAVGYGDEIHVD